MDTSKLPNNVADLRQEPRYRCTVTQVAVAASHIPEPFPGLLLEVSKSGLRLQSPTPLDKGTHVTVSFTKGRKMTVIQAESCFCAPGQDGNFEIGFGISDSVTTLVDTE